MPILQIELLGGVTITVDGHRITELATRKAEALLIYLACQPTPHQRETLADLLWDDLPAERAAGNLRLTLNQLRKHLGAFLDSTRQTIALRQDVEYWLDVQAFAETLADPAADPAAIERALALYRGDFLHGFHLRDAAGFSAWQASQRDHWQRQALTQMRTLSEIHSAHSNYPQAIEWVSRILSIDPLDEAAHRQAMLLLARSGQRAAAIRQYQTCRELVQQELGLDPEPATEALYQRIRRIPAQRPHTLPVCNSALLGRTAELAQISTWLARPASRLMSIIGLGGSGKTRLALTAGWRIVTEHLGPCSDGVFYIPLIVHDDSVALIDDARMLMMIAASLQITLAATGDLLDQLAEHLRDKEVLLIIDNGELLGSSARRALSTLVQHTPMAHVLVPSRERLTLHEEQILELGGLSYPALPSHLVTPLHEERFRATIQEYESVQLFLECAGQVQGSGDLSDFSVQDQLAIGKICQIVHGLPLAIELVAPWLRIQSPAEIAREIAQAIDLLVADMPDIPARHRSMRVVFAYSWQLIADHERVALARLSVFPASFTTDAATAIAGVTLRQLAALRDKSLIQRSTADSGTRYALHPFLRHLAREKLQSDSSATALLCAAHARYFAAFVAPYENQLRSAEGPAILRAIEYEMDNLRAGWQWAVTAHDLPTLSQYSIPLHDFCAIRGWELEGRHLFRPAAAVVRERVGAEYGVEAQRQAVRVLSCAAELEYILGAWDTAEEELQYSRALLTVQDSDAAPELMFIYKQLGLIAYRRGAYADALHYHQRSLEMATLCADDYKCADTLLAIAGAAYALGDWSYAQQTLQRCHAIYQTLEYHWGIGHTLRFFGMVAMMQADQQAAHAYYQESLTLAQQIGNRLGEALVYDQLGLLYLAQHQLEQSTDAFQQGLTIFQDIGVDIGSARALSHLGRVAVMRGSYQTAQQYHLHAIQIGQRVQAPPLLIECVAGAFTLYQHIHGQDGGEPPASMLLRVLWQHPACAADTRCYIAEHLPEHVLAGASHGQVLHQQWPLERIHTLATTWLTRLFQLQAVGQALP